MLQQVKINNNERELANKVEDEKDIMREIVGDGAHQVGNFVDTDMRFETDMFALHAGLSFAT